MTSPVDRTREYFLLRQAERAARRVPDSLRGEAVRRGAVARQKGAGADQLWGSDHRAEGLALARDALLAWLESARIAARGLRDEPADKPADGETAAGETASATAPADDTWRATLDAVGTSREDVAVVADAAASAQTAALPTLESQVVVEHEALFTSLRGGAAVLAHALGLLGRTGPQVARLRLARVGGGAVGAALFVAAALYVLIPREVRTATASAYLTGYGGYPATRAIDGDTGTEWLLPNGTPGWLDVAFSRPRSLRAVRILNARNPPYHDYAMRDFRVEAYAGNRLVGTAHGTFAAIEPGTAINWRSVPLRASDVTHVRIVCETFHGAAGGVAEVDFE